MPEELFVLPASYGQQRLWLLEQIHPDSALYTEAVGLRLRGTLDGAALSTALTGLVERHEVLHSVLRLDGTTIAQVVLEPTPVDLTVTEVAGGFDDAMQAAERLALEPFDLGNGPLIRADLLRIAPDDHLLVAVVHHAVSDGWSIAVVLRELTAMYAAAVAGVDAGLPELPVQYADFAAWQRQRWESGELASQLDHWRKHLAGIVPLRLPTDHRPGAVIGYDSVHGPVKLPAAMVAHLRAVAPAGDVTAFMVALTAYAVVLSRWSGQPDVVVALPFAGRVQEELESLIGFFVNTLPVRVDLGGDPSFLDLLDQVRESCVQAYRNAEVPFEMLVEELRPERRSGQMPLARTMLALNNTSLPDLIEVAELTVEPVPILQTRAQFDIVVDLAGTGDALAGSVVLQADLFTQETADLLARSITTVTRAASAAPGTPVSRLACPIADLRAAPAEADGPPVAAVRSAGGEPQTPAEILLCRLWVEILEVDAVGVDDEFYATGGNSLRAVRMVMRARELGVELPMEQVLGDHTIRQLAAGL